MYSWTQQLKKYQNNINFPAEKNFTSTIMLLLPLYNTHLSLVRDCQAVECPDSNMYNLLASQGLHDLGFADMSIATVS